MQAILTTWISAYNFVNKLANSFPLYVFVSYLNLSLVSEARNKLGEVP